MVEKNTNSIVLKSIHDYSKIKERTFYKKQLQQIKNLFTNNADISICFSPLNNQKTSQLLKLRSVKNFKNKKFAQFSYSNSRTIEKVYQYQNVKLGVLGQKSKSLKFKNIVQNKYQKQRVKANKNYKLLYQLKKPKQNQQKKLQQLKLKHYDRLTVQLLLKKAQKNSQLQKQLRHHHEHKNRRLITQIYDFTKQCENIQQFKLKSTKYCNIADKKLEKSFYQTRLQICNSNKNKQCKKLDKLQQLNTTDQSYKCIQMHKKSNYQISPWNIKIEENNQY